MDIEVLLNNIIQTAFLPPGISIFMILFGLLIIQRFYASGKILLISGFCLLIILSLPITAFGLNSILEQDKALTLQELKNSQAKAIVILGAGRYVNALEYENEKDSASRYVLERLRYGVYLQKHSGLPILVSGGSPFGNMQSEAAIMQTVLQNTFNKKAKWLDSKSTNTWNNARYSADILKQQGIKKIILVTHATHMARSMMSFKHFGLQPVAAPHGFKTSSKADSGFIILDFLPSASAMYSSSQAMHELIGYFWYTLRYKWLG